MAPPLGPPRCDGGRAEVSPLSATITEPREYRAKEFATTTLLSLASLSPLLDLLPEERLQALLRARSPVTVPEAARPFLLAAFVRHLGLPVLAITTRPDEAEQLGRDVHAFLGAGGAEVFPGWEVLPGEPMSPSVDTMGRR